jgi:signal transduction histidine kinase
MEADEVLPGPDKPVPAEIAHQSGRTRITRLVLPGETVIRKEALGPGGERRVRHEVAMLERLRGVAGVAQLAETPRYPGSVVLADAGGTSLAGAARPLAADELVGLAAGLGRAVAGMHRRGVIHRDITPANIVLSRGGAPCLVDFALATSVAEIRPEFTHHSKIMETLAYLAPEQTGRTGRPVDQRADLYALGAVLYELGTGEPPFGTGDPQRLIHDHLARVPAPAAEANQALPAPLSEIIMRLLEKEPDNRYQTADGLIYDLERLRGARTHRAAAEFRVGERDFPVRLLPPSRLAGRDDEVAAVEAAFAGVLAGHARVAEVLSAMTGATDVRLLPWSEDRDVWFLPAPDADDGAVPLSGTSHDRVAPLSVLRYAQLTREPLVVADAARDDRFARDPYFAGVDCCSLLAVPILSRGMLRAVLLLENRLLSGAFTARRLDVVKLVAGQLAVSLDNTQLYAEFRQIAGEQAALRRVAMLVAQAAPPEEVFAAVAAEAGRLLGVDAAVLIRYNRHDAITVAGSWTVTGGAPPTPVGSQLPLGGHNVTTLVFRTGQAARTTYAAVSGVVGDVATRDWGWRAAAGVPIRVEGRLWGVMIVATTRGELLSADAEERLAGFTELVATAIADTQARMELQRSAEEQAALRRVAELVARAAPPEEVFAAVTAEAGRLHASHLAFLIRYAQDGTGAVIGTWAAPGAPPVAVGTRVPVGGRNVTSLVFQTGRSARIDGYADTTGPFADFAREAGVRASVAVPISVAGRLWGVMIMSSRSEPLPADTEARLTGFTELAATAVANAEAQAEVAASRARTVAAADETRRRIERDLHDGVQQRLVTLALMLSGVGDRIPADVRADVDELRDELAATRQELRDLCQGVHPAILVEVGLGAAIRALARRSPLPVRVQLRTDGRLPASCEVTAYYVAAEAFTNAAKHANASAVDILIEETDGALTVQVRDDGVGGADARRGSGLTGLRDRVEAVGGTMTLNSAAGAGTVLTVLLPVTADDP